MGMATNGEDPDSEKAPVFFDGDLIHGSFFEADVDEEAHDRERE